MKKILFFIIVASCLFGCKSIELPTTEPWEGRYSSVEEFKEKTRNIELRSGQSIWVVSNGTMYRILKKVEK